MSIPTIYTISSSCGHVAERDLSATPAGLRAKKAEGWAKAPCPTCFAKTAKKTLSKEYQAERDELEKAAIEDQERSNLPVLSATPKQGTWGTRERYNLLRNAYIDLVQEGEYSEAEFEEKVLEPARMIGYSGWWIDNREATSATIIELLADSGVDPERNENPY